MASCAIASTVLGVLPDVAPTPTLSNATTRRSVASASMSAGSQLSRLPRKCCSRTSSASPSPSSRYAYSTPLSAMTRCVAAPVYASVLARSSVLAICFSLLPGNPGSSAVSDDGALADFLGGLLDEIRDLLGVRDHRDVA